MKKKQILSVVLTAAMSLTLLAGCGQKNEESKQQESSSQVASSQVAENTSQAGEEDPYKDVRISDEVVTLTMASPTGATAQDWNSTLQFAEYEKRLGVKLDCTTYTDEQWGSKFTLMMASDEMPDLVTWIGTKADAIKYGEEGYLLDYSQYLDVMPTVSRLMKEYPTFAKSITADNGAIYGFTTINLDGLDAGAAGDYCFISQTWLDNVGMERPTTLEEFYNVLKAFKEKDANGNGDPDDEIPMAFSTSRKSALLPIRYAFGINNTNSADSKVLWKANDGQIEPWNTTDNFKEYLKFVHKLYAEKLIYQDSFVVENAELDKLGQEGKIGYISNTHMVGVEKELQDKWGWYQVVGFTQDGYQDEQIWVKVSVPRSLDMRWSANANTEHPEVIAKLVDYLYTPEGSLSGRNGYPGVTFDWIEVDGYKIADHTEKAAAAGMSAGDYRSKYLALGCTGLITYSEGTIYDMLTNIDPEKLTDTNGDCWKVAGVNAIKAEGMRRETTVLKDAYPVMEYSDAEATERATIVTDIETYLENIIARFITGEVDIDAEWDNYIKKLNDMGLERLIEIEQAAYSRLMK